MSSSRRVLYAGGQTTSHYPQSDDDAEDFKRAVAANNRKDFVPPSVGFLFRPEGTNQSKATGGQNPDTKADITYITGCSNTHGRGYWNNWVFIG